MKYTLLICFFISILCGCQSGPAKQQQPFDSIVERFYQALPSQMVNRYFVIFIPQEIAVRYTREKLHRDLAHALSRPSQSHLIHQEDWPRLFIWPEEQEFFPQKTREEQSYFINQVTSGKEEGFSALRSQIQSYDRFRRMTAAEIQQLPVWLQDMLRIPVDDVLFVDAQYLGYPDYTYEYKFTLTLKNLRSGVVEGIAEGNLRLPYRIH